ncbi:DUF6465 family protein [Clostridium cellulovorans]|uniref:Uncharacterized protein n=1 Tax=Clostridium cellulovorans (strain ATCC 35296 / DSM 3052 / OCM 3 / 743B) TaxID=573061 RepID=D9SVC1_CLOC7|nr:DUF6465 family protein [Clostridium cellulovorans]ADL51045.1 hypothetical protein Clocel_1291 [Clostridium cellulovorans 743B]
MKRDVKKSLEKVVDTVETTAKKTAENLETVAKEVGSAAKKTAQEVMANDTVKKAVNTTKATASKVAKEGEAAVKNTVQKVAKKKVLSDGEFYIQSCNNEISYNDIMKSISKELEEIVDFAKVKEFKVYYKVEEKTAYCVVNGTDTYKVAF